MKNLLLYDLNYRQLIRYYNNRFSFASFSANVLNEHKKGIYNLKIQDQVCHVTPNNSYARKGETLYGGQIYIYDDYKATKQKYKCHINVEDCASIMSIKYIYKYLHKGHDRAFVKILKNNENVDKETYDVIILYLIILTVVMLVLWTLLGRSKNYHFQIDHILLFV